MSHFLTVEESGITITSKNNTSEGWKIYENNVEQNLILLKKKKRVRTYLLREIYSETEWRATLLDEQDCYGERKE